MGGKKLHFSLHCFGEVTISSDETITSMSLELVAMERRGFFISSIILRYDEHQ